MSYAKPKDWSFNNKMAVTYCSERDKFPKIQFMLDGYWFEMSPKDYVITASDDGIVCALAFQQNL